MASGDAPPGVSRRFRQESHVPTYALDQTTGLSGEATHPGASAPTSTPSGFPYSKSVVFASSATLPLLTQKSLCCIDRLNPQPVADTSANDPRVFFYPPRNKRRALSPLFALMGARSIIFRRGNRRNVSTRNRYMCLSNIGIFAVIKS